MAKLSREQNRVKRHERVRKTVFGTPEMPRLCVYRSTKNIYAQVIDDVNGKTLAAASTLDKDIKAACAYGGNKEAAKKAGIETVCFDRGGYLYHGRVKELADGAREAGLQF